jgi:hypothetical protein
VAHPGSWPTGPFLDHAMKTFFLVQSCGGGLFPRRKYLLLEFRIGGFIFLLDFITGNTIVLTECKFGAVYEMQSFEAR